MNRIERIRVGMARCSERGIAAVEFALMLPVWITLFLGVSDGAFYLLACEKVDRAAYTVTDVVTQYESVTLADLNDISLAASQIMQPLSFADGNGVLIVSSVYKAAGSQPSIEWQYSYPPGTPGQPSKVGAVHGFASLPGGLAMNDNDNVIISEVYYNYSPLFVVPDMFAASTIYRAAVYKPRLSPLIIPPT